VIDSIGLAGAEFALSLPIPCGQELCRLLDRIRADLPVLDAG